MTVFHRAPDRPPVAPQQPTVHPMTYYEQLAEAGALYDFLQTNMPDRFSSDREFRRQMLGVLLRRSTIVLPEVEHELLCDLSSALSQFLTAVERCHNNQSESP
jgi:hypothetical protein